jgi:hypothetical protein
MRRALLAILTVSMSATAGVTVDKVAYGGWPNCYRISNGEVELILTSDVGPRVIRYGFVGGQNLFKEFKEQMGKTGESSWQSRGGHRLWIAPEDAKDTYALDNKPVNIEVRNGGREVIATQAVEPETGLQKQIIIRMADTGSNVELLHRIKNSGQRVRNFAPWSLTVMAAGGTGIIPLPPRGKHPENLLPANPFVMWSYTDLSDPRWKFTSKYIMLRQDKAIAAPQKAGTFNVNNVAAYLLGSDLFVKRTKADATKKYPDFGCSFETFTNNEMLELETLGPLVDLAPGATVEHTERWSLHKNVAVSRWNDAELDRAVLPFIK